MTFSPLISGTIEHHNKYSKRSGKVSRVIQHHWASASLAGERALAAAGNQKSANYLVYDDGRIVGQVPEEFRAWTSGSMDADGTAITIECQNHTGAPGWTISDEAIDALVRLLADIGQRYGFGVIDRSKYLGHQQFASTACPGPYLYPRLQEIAQRANAIKNPAAAPTPAPTAKILEDGMWGEKTTRRLQYLLGTQVDGVLSHQYKSAANENIYSAQFDKTMRGSLAVKAMQKRLGIANSDGLCGPETIRTLQRHYGTTADGVISPVSEVVKAMQRALNAGRF